MKDIGKDAGAVRTSYQLICPKCGKPAFRRENSRAGVAYLHLTKKGSVRHMIEPEGKHPSSAPSGHLPPKGKARNEEGGHLPPKGKARNEEGGHLPPRGKDKDEAAGHLPPKGKARNEEGGHLSPRGKGKGEAAGKRKKDPSAALGMTTGAGKVKAGETAGGASCLV